MKVDFHSGKEQFEVSLIHRDCSFFLRQLRPIGSLSRMRDRPSITLTTQM